MTTGRNRTAKQKPSASRRLAEPRNRAAKQRSDASQRLAELRKADPAGKQVAIFGAGITGLTVAHELIERGYQVHVFEKDEADAAQERLAGEVCAIGGIARTQWGSLPIPREDKHTHPVPRLPPVEIFFEEGTNDLKARQEEKIKKVAKAILRIDPAFVVEIRGYSRVRTRSGFPDKIAEARTEEVKKLLLAENVPENRLATASYGLGRADDWTAAEEDRDYVDFHVQQDLVPGEHGFRFFPSFYRNLFDTMSRIPIADDRSEFQETSLTVHDNIVSTEFQRLGLIETQGAGEDRSVTFSRRAQKSVTEAFHDAAKIMTSLECTAADIARHQLKLFKYMTSCTERRTREYEYQSWYQFMGADQFSAKFREIFDRTGQTNVAVRTKRCDARTYGNVSVQLFLDQVRVSEKVDATLNGPTSSVWFDHWRRYLEEQGVVFRRGELVGWEFFDDVPRPVVKVWRRATANEAEKSERAGSETDETLLELDFYVVAVPLDQAVGLFEKPGFRGADFDRLRAFKASIKEDKVKERKIATAESTEKAMEVAEQHLWLRACLAGVQFFLPSDGAFVRGHTSYLESKWRLSSIAQPQFWSRRRGWWDGYRGVLSVDIGDWSAASRVTRKEIIEGVWDQVRETIKDRRLIPEHYVAAHIDRFITFDANDKPAENSAPYLVTRPGEFPQRPGRLDDDNGYEVHLKRVMLAGSYMQTHTRLTTMESANESGRHAVNGILFADNFKGARCEIKNPEKYEMRDLDVLRDLDRRLVTLGLPHVADILDLTEVPFSLLGAGADPNQVLDQLGRGLDGADARR